MRCSIRHFAVASVEEKDFKAKGFVIIANKLATDLLYVRLDQYRLKFVILLISVIYVHVVIYSSSEVKPKLIL